MTSPLLNKQLCLALNRVWQPMGFRSLRKGIEDVTSLNPKTGEPPFMFMDLTFEQNADGTFNTDKLLNARPVSVEEWMTLPVRSCDVVIHSGRRKMRAPTIIIATNYDKVNFTVPQFSSENVWERDNSTCQVTGQKVTRETGDLGHDIARAKGGKRTWRNVGVIRKDLNRQMGTRSFAEMGWKVNFSEPKPRPIFYTQRDATHITHRHFLEPANN